MVGAFISNCFNFVNYTWILKLPTEFFYLCGLFWFNILGGTGVFCLGYYGYGASISTEETRTRVLGKSKNNVLDLRNLQEYVKITFSFKNCSDLSLIEFGFEFQKIFLITKTIF